MGGSITSTCSFFDMMALLLGSRLRSAKHYQLFQQILREQLKLLLSNVLLCLQYVVKIHFIRSRWFFRCSLIMKSSSETS